MVLTSDRAPCARTSLFRLLILGDRSTWLSSGVSTCKFLCSVCVAGVCEMMGFASTRLLGRGEYVVANGLDRMRSARGVVFLIDVSCACSTRNSGRGSRSCSTSTSGSLEVSARGRVCARLIISRRDVRLAIACCTFRLLRLLLLLTASC